MKTLPFFQVDAFTRELFKGNPAGVVPLESWPDDHVLQQIAMENNLSETAFFVNENKGFRLRWFTPVSEVDLCGHATLATSHVLFHHLDYRGDHLTFYSKSGILKVIRQNDLITLDFPTNAPEQNVISEQLTEALGIIPTEVFKNRDFMAVFESEDVIKNLKPDLNELKKLDALGIIVTAPGINSDFVSRFFAPVVGIDEDPVTGSAHTMLVPYWGKRLHKKKLHAYQLSQRGGELFCEWEGDRVLISGKAITYLKGEIYI